MVQLSCYMMNIDSLSMKNFALSDEQLKELKAAHKRERSSDGVAAYKINAVILLGTGWTLERTSAALLLDDETLRSYIEKYRAGGIDGLVKTNYAGKARRLDDSQINALTEELSTKIYMTTKGVIDYVKDACNVSYTLSGMRDLLHGLGYAFKKPKLVPGNPDREAQEIWVKQYEEFIENKAPGVPVLFMDAVHPEHNTMAAYAWMPEGERLHLPTNSGRQRLNLHGAINVETQDITVIESQSVNADSTIQLLDVLQRTYAGAEEIFVILDNARYHYSKEVKAWLEGDGRRIRLVFLPPYSPELNLIERVWRFFKKNVLYNTYYKSVSDFRAAAIQFFRNIDQHKDDLVSLLDGGFEGFNYT
jgi:transposase